MTSLATPGEATEECQQHPSPQIPEIATDELKMNRTLYGFYTS